MGLYRSWEIVLSHIILLTVAADNRMIGGLVEDFVVPVNFSQCVLQLSLVEIGA